MKLMKKPLFILGPQKKFTKKQQNMNYKKAHKSYGIKPFGDTDRDGYYNIFDCKPLNPKKHSVREKDKDRPVPSYSIPNLTYEKVFEKAEKKIPLYESEKDDPEGPASLLLTEALYRREKFFKKTGELPTSKVVGSHDVYIPGTSPYNPIIQRSVGTYLKHLHPDKHITWSKENESKLNVIDIEKGEKQEGVSISKLLSAAPRNINAEIKGVSPKVLEQARISPRNIKTTVQHPWYITDLPTHFSKGKPVVMHISDEPVDILMKSTMPGRPWRSCETLPSTSSKDYKWEIPSTRRALIKEIKTERKEHPYPPNAGMYWRGPFYDVINLNATASIFRSRDAIKEGKTPMGRAMVRWGTPTGLIDDTKYLGVEHEVYGLESSSEKEFIPFLVQNILRKKKVFSLPLFAPYIHGGYGDTVAHSDKAYEALESKGLVGERDYDSGTDAYVGIPPVYLKEYKQPDTKKPSYIESIEQFKNKSREEISKIPTSFHYPLYEQKLFIDLQDKILEITPHKDIINKEILTDLPSSHLPLSKNPFLTPVAKKILLEDTIGNRANTRLLWNPSLTKKERKSLINKVEPMLYTLPTLFREYSESFPSSPQYNQPRKQLAQYMRYHSNPSDMSDLLSSDTPDPTFLREYYHQILKDKEQKSRNVFELAEITHSPKISPDLINDYLKDPLPEDSGIKKVDMILHYLSYRKFDEFKNNPKAQELLNTIYKQYRNNPRILEAIIPYFSFLEPKNKQNIKKRMIEKTKTNSDLSTLYFQLPDREIDFNTALSIYDKLPDEKSIKIGYFVNRFPELTLDDRIKFVDVVLKKSQRQRKYYSNLFTERILEGWSPDYSKQAKIFKDFLTEDRIKNLNETKLIMIYNHLLDSTNYDITNNNKQRLKPALKKYIQLLKNAEIIPLSLEEKIVMELNDPLSPALDKPMRKELLKTLSYIKGKDWILSYIPSTTLKELGVKKIPKKSVKTKQHQNTPYIPKKGDKVIVKKIWDCSPHYASRDKYEGEIGIINELREGKISPPYPVTVDGRFMYASEAEPYNLKVGDRVRMSNDALYAPGIEGTVIKVRDDGDYIIEHPYPPNASVAAYSRNNLDKTIYTRRRLIRL